MTPATTRLLLIGTFTLSILACSSGEGDTALTDTGTSGTDTHGYDTSGETAGSGLTELTDPCNGGGTPYALYYTSDTDGLVGCGNGFGLHHTTDGGDSFTRVDSGDLYVFQLAPDRGGDVLVCGRDYDAAADDAILYRYDGQLHDLLHYGNNSSRADAVYFSNCGVVGAAGDGTMVAASNTIGDLTWSEDNGATWVKEERYWEDANLAPDGYAVYTMLDFVAAGGAYYGAGSTITEPPTFLGPSQDPDGTWHNFHATVIDPGMQGEVWALATPDDGTTWIAGGRDERRSSEASGFLYRSDDAGATWTYLTLPPEIDIVHDVSFAPDGQHGVAVGHRYPTSLGGFILLTDDAGASWAEVDEKTPLLQSAFARNDRYWVAGDAFQASGGY